MGAIGVFEADANAGKLSAEASANNGFELEKSIDRAIFRAKERFGAYLANSRSRSEWDERWSEVSNQVIKVIAEVVTPLLPLRPAIRNTTDAPQTTKTSRSTAGLRAKYENLNQR